MGFKESNEKIDKFLEENDLRKMHLEMWFANKGFEVYKSSELPETL